MTALAKSAIANPYSAKFVHSLVGMVPAALVSIAVGWTTIMFAQDTGGRGPMSLTRAAVPLLLALIASRPWRRVSARVLALASAVAVAALMVCALTPPGWFGANRAASYAFAAATFVTVAAYVRRTANVYLIASILTVAGGIQFFRALVPWWGSRDPSSVMVGTFYWHNQFGAFLLVPAILGVALIVANRAPYRFVGWIITPFAAAGVVFSTSRGSEMALAVGWLLVGVLSACARRNVRVLLARWVAASVLCGVMPFVLAGPPFFSTWHVPWASTQARAATGETLEQNSNVRIYFWRQSLIVFEHHPVAGVGYGALSNEAVKLTPANWPRSPLAHDDYLQSLADGGLLLGLPFLLACGAIGFVLLRRTLMLLRHGTTDPLRIGVVVCAMALMAHAAIDFDWSYPALFATAAAVAGLA
ncbi:MAG TPA: O-antigen ligase family protein, partial [Acidothermaceae bacterium]|nr:O-antigen ligase family protein [Acidothermaceae bacterium]